MTHTYQYYREKNDIIRSKKIIFYFQTLPLFPILRAEFFNFIDIYHKVHLRFLLPFPDGEHNEGGFRGRRGEEYDHDGISCHSY